MDVLETHPRVDPTRLGDAGCSGGGTQVRTAIPYIRYDELGLRVKVSKVNIPW